VWLILANDDNESISSSDESLAIEFPPPPIAFSTPESSVQTTIDRSDSGKYSDGKRKIFSKNSILFYSYNRHY
jgi:hypothetical protein